MPRKPSPKNVRNVCSVCGRVFFSNAPAAYCTDKSTCRVKHNQEKKRQEFIAKKLTMDFDAYGVYAGFVQRFPALKPQIDEIIMKGDIDTAMKSIALAWGAVMEFEQELKVQP